MTANVPQTVVNVDQDPGLVGQITNPGFARVDTATSEETVNPIPFGIFVQTGTHPDGALLLTATNNRLKGIVSHAQSFERNVELSPGGLMPFATFGVLAVGRMTMLANTDVTETSEVHVCAVANSGYVIGQAGATAVSTKTIDITPFARWTVPGTKGSIVELEIDLTNVALATADA